MRAILTILLSCTFIFSKAQLTQKNLRDCYKQKSLEKYTILLEDWRKQAHIIPNEELNDTLKNIRLLYQHLLKTNYNDTLYQILQEHIPDVTVGSVLFTITDYSVLIPTTNSSYMRYLPYNSANFNSILKFIGTESQWFKRHSKQGSRKSSYNKRKKFVLSAISFACTWGHVVYQPPLIVHSIQFSPDMKEAIIKLDRVASGGSIYCIFENNTWIEKYKPDEKSIFHNVSLSRWVD